MALVYEPGYVTVEFRLRGSMLRVGVIPASVTHNGAELRAKQCPNFVHGQLKYPAHHLLSSEYGSRCGIARNRAPSALNRAARLELFFFTNSGSEAVEALKMACGITRKQTVVAMQGAFYRRTFSGMGWR